MTWILDKCTDKHIQAIYAHLMKAAVPVVPRLFLKANGGKQVVRIVKCWCSLLLKSTPPLDRTCLSIFQPLNEPSHVKYTSRVPH